MELIKLIRPYNLYYLYNPTIIISIIMLCKCDISRGMGSLGCNKEFILHSTQYCHNSFDSVNKAFYHKCALYKTSKRVTVHWVVD